MQATTIRGVAGAVEWGYYSAASVGAWELTVDATGGSLTGMVIESDAFSLSQPDLTFRVNRQNGPPFVWPVLSLLVDGASLTARLGPQEG